MATARVNECFDSIIENGADLLPKEVALAIKHWDEAPRKVHTNVKRYLKQVGGLLNAVKASGDTELLELLGMEAPTRRTRKAEPEATPRSKRTAKETPTRRTARGEDSPQRKTRGRQEVADDDFELEEEKPVTRGTKRPASKLQTVKSPLPRKTAKADDFDDFDDEVPASRIKKQAKTIRRPRV